MEFLIELRGLIANHPLWSFLTALAIGALPYLFKYTIGVYISEKVKEYRKNQIDKKKLQSLVAQSEKLRDNQEGKLFSFGKAKASIYVLDYSSQGYSKDFLISKLLDFVPDCPDQYRAEYEKQFNYWNEKKNSGEIFEGTPKIALPKISVGRSPLSERKQIQVSICQSPGYVHQRAATSVFRNLDSRDIDRIIKEPSHTMEPFFSNSFGILIGIITGDNKLIFVERGRGTSVNENRIVCGAVEGMTVDDISNSKLDTTKAASRALSEEFGINLEPNELSSINIVSCVFNCDFHEWNLIGYVDLRDYGEKYISAHIHDYNTTAKGHDSWEVNEMIFIDFTPQNVAGYLLSHDDNIVNYSMVTAIYTLLSAYGDRAEVARAFSSSIDLTSIG